MTWAGGTLQFASDRLTVRRTKMRLFGLGRLGSQVIPFTQITAAELRGHTLRLTFVGGSHRVVHGVIQRRAVADALRQRGIDPAEVFEPVATPGA